MSRVVDNTHLKKRERAIVAAVLAGNVFVTILVYSTHWHFIRGYNEVTVMFVWPSVIVLSLLNLFAVAIYSYRRAHGTKRFGPIAISFFASALLVLASPLFAPWLGCIAKNNLWINTPISEAARYGDAPLVIILLQHGKDPNARQPSLGTTPLHYMAFRGETEAVELLLEKGADPNAEADYSLETPLQWAIRGQASFATIDLLKKYGAK